MNQRLKQSGFETLGNLARAFANSVIRTKELVEPLSNEVATNVVRMLSTQYTANGIGLDNTNEKAGPVGLVPE